MTITLRNLVAILVCGVPMAASAEYQGIQTVTNALATFEGAAPCADKPPTRIVVTVGPGKSKVWLLGDTRDMEPGTPIRLEAVGQLATVSVFGYDADCTPTTAFGGSGGSVIAAEVVGSPREVLSNCLDAATIPDGEVCPVRGVKISTRHASMHGSYVLSDGRTARVDLDWVQTNNRYLLARIRANPVRAALHLIAQAVPLAFAEFPDVDLDEIVANPNPDARFRYDLTLSEAELTGTVTIDGVDVLAGTTATLRAILDATVLWHGPDSDFGGGIF